MSEPWRHGRRWLNVTGHCVLARATERNGRFRDYSHGIQNTTKKKSLDGDTNVEWHGCL